MVFMTIQETELAMKSKPLAASLTTLITPATELGTPQQKNDYYFIAYLYAHRHKARAISASKHYWYGQSNWLTKAKNNG